MKRVLITGANSYIGTSFEKWAKEKHPGEFAIDTVEMVDGSWREKSFSGYDAVFHVAAIVHQKETKENRDLYYSVNRDLAIQVAQKAKEEGVRQFILMSSMSVYGINTGMITKQTRPMPKSNYGQSKLQADHAIYRMHNKAFQVAILRPPMIYGKGCKGNYVLLSKFVLKSGCFPNIKNQRSMLYIGNLCAFLIDLIDFPRTGIFFPQNKEYVCTSQMAFLIGSVHEKNIKRFSIFNDLIRRLHIPILNKIFGDLTYEKTDICDYVSFEDSIKITESER